MFTLRYDILSMSGADTFTKLGEISVLTSSGADIKLFRIGTRLFAGVRAYSSVRSTFSPQSEDVFFPFRTMTIYEIKNGKAELVRQEEKCFGLSQLIDGQSVYVTY